MKHLVVFKAVHASGKFNVLALAFFLFGFCQSGGNAWVTPLIFICYCGAHGCVFPLVLFAKGGVWHTKSLFSAPHPRTALRTGWVVTLGAFSHVRERKLITRAWKGEGVCIFGFQYKNIFQVHDFHTVAGESFQYLTCDFHHLSNKRFLSTCVLIMLLLMLEMQLWTRYTQSLLSGNLHSNRGHRTHNTHTHNLCT